MNLPIAKLALLLFALCLELLIRPTAAQTSVYTELLKKQGMPVNSDSLSTYLARFTPSPDRDAKIQSLIQQLGDDKYRIRIAATNKLLNLKKTSAIDLGNATSHTDPEIRKRARKVIAAAEKKVSASEILHAILQVVSNTKTTCVV